MTDRDPEGTHEVLADLVSELRELGLTDDEVTKIVKAKIARERERTEIDREGARARDV